MPISILVPANTCCTRAKWRCAAAARTAATPPLPLGYGFESSGSRHDHTYFPVDSAFYMTFCRPLAFVQPDGTMIANVGWSEAQGAWQAHLQSSKVAV